METKVTEMQSPPVKSEAVTIESSSAAISKPSRLFVLADLNVNPPETDAESCAEVLAPDITKYVCRFYRFFYLFVNLLLKLLASDLHSVN